MSQVWEIQFQKRKISKTMKDRKKKIKSNQNQFRMQDIIGRSSIKYRKRSYNWRIHVIVNFRAVLILFQTCFIHSQWFALFLFVCLFVCFFFKRALFILFQIIGPWVVMVFPASFVFCCCLWGSATCYNSEYPIGWGTRLKGDLKKVNCGEV